MRYTTFCIVDGSDMSESIFANLARAGFTSTEVALTSAEPSHASETLDADLDQRTDDAPAQPLYACSMVGATLSLIAGLSSFVIPESADSDPALLQPTTLEGAVSAESQPAPILADERLERVRTIAYHLCPGKSLLSVHTDNGYEIETILEIFRAGGASHCEHIAANGELDRVRSSPGITALVHDRTTILNDRVRESA
jgi:hypothetical protein